MLEFTKRIPFKKSNNFTVVLIDFMKRNNPQDMNTIIRYIYGNGLNTPSAFAPLDLKGIYTTKTTINGVEITNTDNDIIIDYLTVNNIPLIHKTYVLARTKYLNGEITAEMVQKQKEQLELNVKDMGNYIEMQKELSKNKERLEIASIKSLELDNNSNEIKDIVNNLKNAFTNKDKYVLNKDDKDKIDKFIQQVDSTNKEYKKMQKLSITLNDVETELKENREKVKILTENNDALNIKVKSLEKKIDKQENEIDDLKEKNSKLQSTINFFENLFDRLVKFIKDKMFGKEKEREDYWKFSKDLYNHNIFSDKTIESIQEDYIWNKENDKDKDKGKDDYEIGM